MGVQRRELSYPSVHLLGPQTLSLSDLWDEVFGAGVWEAVTSDISWVLPTLLLVQRPL